MSLKLFRHTGFHSVLTPGETRVALHPGWAITGASLWIGFACNVWVWRALVGGSENLGRSLVAGAVVAGIVGFVLSLFGWRRTLKPMATLLFLVAALLAGGTWVQDLSFQAAVEGKRLGLLLPPWASFFRWQLPTLLVLLGLLPMIWIWNAQLRRLGGPVQLRSNILGMVLAACVAAGALSLLGRLPA
ncbi:MAG TPA: hypothetical protein VFE82_14435 [Ramlibacter sp.]|jgi:lipid A ethanolaminephosphotransferase|uniref:hypothetical protein n=1 Tax=Ramlibacter sp. TaxID=1917967 RepID=UPI002D5F06A2|nr:hypothetical protein [Ramlibacter sp.]HZY19670.1 hypothetical protein [Ramlibacter sp.]